MHNVWKYMLFDIVPTMIVYDVMISVSILLLVLWMMMADVDVDFVSFSAATIGVYCWES